MNTLEKLEILGAGTKWDICTPSSPFRQPTNNSRIGFSFSAGICKSFTPDGRCVSLLKVLNSNACIHDCKYCIHSTSCTKKEKKTMFEPKELADLFLHLYLRNYVEGLFLSSAVIGSAEKTNEKLLEVVNILRNKYKFQGYIHLKVMPGTNKSTLKELISLADRVSLNLESPCASTFTELCSTKDYKIDLIRRIKWINKLNKKRFSLNTFSTQLIVGAANETDLNYLNAMKKLYEKFNTKRIYFSAFESLKGTAFENKESVSLKREKFLYKIDWLYRFYGYSFKELKKILNEKGFFPLNADPKQLIAFQEKEKFPLNINTALKEELLRVPGIGLKSAKKIIQTRKVKKILSFNDLKSFGVILRKALPFIELNGKKQLKLGEFY
jgi:putative DNA modification/repair radical SAM protein